MLPPSVPQNWLFMLKFTNTQRQRIQIVDFDKWVLQRFNLERFSALFVRQNRFLASGSSKMATLVCGRRSSADISGATSEVEEDEEGSICFSDADDGSCNSQFYSTADGDGFNHDYSSEILEDENFESRRASLVSDPCDCSVDLESGKICENKVNLGSLERDCRICQLNLVGSSPGSGVAIELGCSCKDDLAAAHKHCAETWFKIKGNKNCEICHSIALNVVDSDDIEAGQQTSFVASITLLAPATSIAETRRCLNGPLLLNLLLACILFAFAISWLYDFNKSAKCWG